MLCSTTADPFRAMRLDISILVKLLRNRLAQMLSAPFAVEHKPGDIEFHKPDRPRASCSNHKPTREPSAAFLPHGVGGRGNNCPPSLVAASNVNGAFQMTDHDDDMPASGNPPAAASNDGSMEMMQRQISQLSDEISALKRSVEERDPGSR